MKRLAIIAALAASVVAGAPASAEAKSTYRTCGKVGDFTYKAGKDTSCRFAKRILFPNSPCDGVRYLRSPVNHRVYRITCLGVLRPHGTTVITFGGKGDNGTVIRARIIIPYPAN